ncbi:rhomboid family intramembrane serine protease GlpG [Shewanella avicenniae]|uniref:Rhomboid family intramembrane serine protease GlpG n=1 Tax=Shewanella avicenniae TaxID=2814294 RepID=A0ABX7QQS6_9GAMM|nr:rhomboid family intramembrane serine protease GlpG [Shewanella avicenniae]QSX33634.1 rhomboid family intramembrane serine protease GlpG [Shewanella avicenniae]
MLEIGRLPSQRAAMALTDYLKSQGISTHIEHAAQGVIIYVLNERDAAQAKREFNNFIHNPMDGKYLQASWEVGDSKTQLDYGAPGLQLLSQLITGAGPVTLITLMACVAIYIVMLFVPETIFNALSFFGASSDSHWQIWRLFTPSLLHFSLLHIAFNMLWWWYLGGRIENALGSGRLLLLLIVAGTLPNMVQFFFSGPDFGGLSGVVYGLIGYSWVMSQWAPQRGLVLQPSLMGFMLLSLVLGFSGAMGDNIANSAHLAGLLAGLLQGWLDSRRKS